MDGKERASETYFEGIVEGYLR